MRYQYLRYPGGKGKAVTFSYDDGVLQDIRLEEILNRHGLKCTFNLHGMIFRNDNASEKEKMARSFLERGHEIAVHGDYHRAEGNIRPIEGIRDVLNCRLELEKRFDRIIRGMAYPDSGITRFSNGTDYDTVKAYLKDLDIAYARTLSGDNNKFELPTDWHSWMPTAHHNNPQIFEYIDEFLNIKVTDPEVYLSRRFPRLFYVWGHSYEFDNNDNWDRLEEICSRISGKEDIWYATNIEIYDYVTAYQSLIYSADGLKIYNPSLYTIWFERDKVLYKIESGETIAMQEG